MVLIFYSLHCVTCHFRVISALLLLHIITIILNHFWDLDFYRKDFYDQAKATNEKSNIEIADYDWEDTKVEKQNTRKRLCYIPFPFVRIRYIHATFEHQFQLLLFSFCFFIFPIFAITFHSFFCFYRFFFSNIWAPLCILSFFVICTTWLTVADVVDIVFIIIITAY